MCLLFCRHGGTFFTTILTGGLSEEVTPVLIPNTAVKLFSADDTRQGESRSLVAAGKA